MILDSGKTGGNASGLRSAFESVVTLDSGKTSLRGLSVDTVFESVVILDSGKTLEPETYEQV